MSTPSNLFPGFKVSPLDPSRDLRPSFMKAAEPPDMDDDEPNYDDYDDCQCCGGWGYTDCHCGGDLCVCSYNGEKPCWSCI